MKPTKCDTNKSLLSDVLQRMKTALSDDSVTHGVNREKAPHTERTGNHPELPDGWKDEAHRAQ